MSGEAVGQDASPPLPDVGDSGAGDGCLDAADAPPGVALCAPGEGADTTGAPDRSPGDAAVEAVRDISRQGRGARFEEVLSVLAGQGFDIQAPGLRLQVEEALSAHPGIRSFTGIDGEPLHHDSSLVSATFARIQDRKASPIRLMCEEIRQNSREYPRPVPVELFEAPPFSLTPDMIGEVLHTITQNTEYADIAFAVTSDGAVYLYSTQFLEPAYAEFLAEHAQLLAMNP